MLEGAKNRHAVLGFSRKIICGIHLFIYNYNCNCNKLTCIYMKRREEEEGGKEGK